MSTILENSVQTLAAALDRLETSLDDRLTNADADHEAVDAARRQAGAAKRHLTDASAGVSASIKELRAVLDTDPTADAALAEDTE